MSEDQSTSWSCDSNLRRFLVISVLKWYSPTSRNTEKRWGFSSPLGNQVPYQRRTLSLPLREPNWNPTCFLVPPLNLSTPTRTPCVSLNLSIVVVFPCNWVLTSSTVFWVFSICNQTNHVRLRRGPFSKLMFTPRLTISQTSPGTVVVGQRMVLP